jgi:hypothetical protein
MVSDTRSRQDEDAGRAERHENGVDLTLIRQMLAKTPAQRLAYMSAASRNMAAMRRAAHARSTEKRAPA